MAQQVINLGVVPNDGLGTPLRNAGAMINNNFSELYAVIIPTQTGQGGKFLTTDGSVLSWASTTTGTVTSVGATGSNGVSISGSPITTSGSFTIGLDAITPTSVAASGTVTGSNLSGTNTGDQTITLTGDATGSGTSSFAVTLANTSVVPGSYTSADITIDSKGRITAAANGIPGGGGTVTSVDITANDGISATGGPITTAGSITLGLGAITPTSVAASGTVTGSNLSGTNTGDQTLNSLLPDQTGNAGLVLGTDGSNTSWVATSSGTVTSVDISSGNLTVGGGPITTSGTLTVDLPDTAVTPGSYTYADFTVDAQGRITAASSNATPGTVTSVDVVGNNGITVSGSPVIDAGIIALGLDNVVANTVTSNGAMTLDGNFTFNATGQRVLGDFSNALASSRVIFQSSVTNGDTNLIAIPNGTGTVASFSMQASSDPNNASIMSIYSASTTVGLNSLARGSGTTQPMHFLINSNSKLEIDVNGNVVLGSQVALSTSATDGFTYIPTTAGTPTGTPTSFTGKVPMVVDTTTNTLWIYISGVWRSVTLT